MSTTTPNVDLTLWGERVRVRRELLGMSQRQLAAALPEPTTQQTIWKIEHGLIHPRDSLRLMIATALRSRPAELFPYEVAA